MTAATALKNLINTKSSNRSQGAQLKGFAHEFSTRYQALESTGEKLTPARDALQGEQRGVLVAEERCLMLGLETDVLWGREKSAETGEAV